MYEFQEKCYNEPTIHSNSVAHRGKHVNPVATRQDAVNPALTAHTFSMPQLTCARMYHHTPIFTAFDNVNGQVLRSQSSCCAIGRVVIIKHSAITCHHTPSPHTLHRGAQRAACPSAQAATAFTSECRGVCLLQQPMPRRVSCCSCAVVFVSHSVIYNGITTEIATPSIAVFNL